MMTTKQRVGEWIETYMGISFYSFDPAPDEISMTDIAHSLSLICRFNGHTKHFYSVAQHSLNVFYELEAMGASREIQLRGLLHDASEAYLCDIPRPLKPFVQGYFEVEERVQNMIYAKYGVDDVDDRGLVKQVDDWMLGFEAHRLMPCKNWNPPEHTFIADVDVHPHMPEVVERLFMSTVNMLLTS